MSDPAALEFERVFKALGNRKVLDDVSFKVNAGEALCILGRSGTGKSVTLKLMIGLLKPDSGTGGRITSPGTIPKSSPPERV